MNKFIILGTQRTGSTFIASTLGGHPQIACGLEWSRGIPFMQKIKGISRGLEGDFSLLSAKHREHMDSFTDYAAIGFRYLFSSSAQYLYSPALSPSRVYERMSSLISLLHDKPEIKIIHIVRESHLNWLASMYLAKASGAFFKQEYDTKQALTIPLAEAEKRIRAKIDLDRRFSQLEHISPYCRVSMETYSSNMEEQARQLYNYLGVDTTFQAETRTKKQLRKPVEDVVANHEMLQAMIDRVTGSMN